MVHSQGVGSDVSIRIVFAIGMCGYFTAFAKQPDFLLIPIDAAPRYAWESHRQPPASAIIGGSEQRLICRAQDKQGRYHPGRYDRARRSCIIVAQQRWLSRRHHQFLIANNLHWQNSRNGQIPADAVVASDLLEPARLPCSAEYRHSWYPGEVTQLGCAIVADKQILIQYPYRIVTKF